MVIQLSPRQSPQGAPRDRQGAAFGFNKSALVRLSAASKTVCGVLMGAVIKSNIGPLRSRGMRPFLAVFGVNAEFGGGPH